MEKLNVKKDRIAIKNIIYKNIELMRKYGNKEALCQDLADAILVYLIEEKK